jgi:hypothetical protein
MIGFKGRLSFRQMGGVDKFDQLASYCPVGRPGCKWWRYVLWYVVNLAVVKAWILFSKSPKDTPPPHRLRPLAVPSRRSKSADSRWIYIQETQSRKKSKGLQQKNCVGRHKSPRARQGGRTEENVSGVFSSWP